ncbi:pantoate--beta-alanine ligase [Bermanella marisrubri]|uniref:Pantothenate synthetase n=1 Tax=Bermanella marisrubri TaxID=207949 RepID=Q1N0Z1_9GAMM|nr:pantoate--beta-alanine ligase [Bermanella marisrubri]EAT11883.1 pantoate--beta-alanine ligase [Oceanobacter sp. RED65] [Bermanella marisrubri]QIZ83040.1 pantoate--beta-alanine ligase [Bermanella marisrubri]
MKTVETIAELQTEIKAARAAGKRIGFVPTMGNLHEGHMILVDAAAEECDYVVASIFINPLQFNDIDDLGRYPRTLSADQEHLKDRDCDLLFYPSVDEMYPDGQEAQTTVSVPVVSEGLCGDSRPGHFDGVATVVSKLFHMVQPDAAFFGEKDFQQLAVIRKMVRDLNLPFDVFGVPTCREENGLAMSSRNNYLSDDEKQTAGQIYSVLTEIKDKILAGERNFAELCVLGKQTLLEHDFQPDYVEVREANSLAPATEDDTDLVILVAAILGKARLIDNMRVNLAHSKVGDI